MQLSPHSASQRHFLLRPLQSSWTAHFLRQLGLASAAVSDEFSLTSRRRSDVQRVALSSSARMWDDTARPVAGRFLSRLRLASESAHHVHHRSINNGRLHFLTWLKSSRLNFGLSAYLSQKVKWFRWAKVLGAKVWSKYILRPKFSWTLV